MLQQSWSAENPVRKHPVAILIQPSLKSLIEMYRTCPCQHLRGGLILQTFAIISIGFIGKVWIRTPNAKSLESVNSSTPFRKLTAFIHQVVWKDVLEKQHSHMTWDSSHNGFAFFLAAIFFSLISYHSWGWLCFRHMEQDSPLLTGVTWTVVTTKVVI